ncbi:MAG: dihydrodipicolinate synthase family protein [Cyclobacteriaceae bacterium]|nr:dihydrodipicolinate synthase family protein [Cyclobacteriaceae bacterium SS2]
MQPSKDIHKLLLEGTVIPAHPLALDANRQLDEFRQKLLTRYYIESGAGGVAVGVHTTQFEIRDPEINLYEKVLALASEEIERKPIGRPFIRVAGVSGGTEQAVNEAKIARDLGYDIVLVSMNGLKDWSESELLKRAEKIGEHIPLFGFYLQPSVGGRVLTEDFWKQFANIPGVNAIKIAPFNRYQSLEVIRAVCNSDRNEEIAIYTGNDDNILNDLLTTYRIKKDTGEVVEKEIVGGLLGHWAVWTQKAVELLKEVKKVKASGQAFDKELLTRNINITDSNSAFFDTKNAFRGCIAGIHEVLKRQGLLEGIWCLNPEETLSPGQSEEISRVYRDYPELNDDDFIKANIETWISEIKQS